MLIDIVAFVMNDYQGHAFLFNACIMFCFVCFNFVVVVCVFLFLLLYIFFESLGTAITL